jgi:hypothetical protein
VPPFHLNCPLTRSHVPCSVQVRLQAGETEEGEGSSDSHGGGHGQGEHAPLKPSSQMALEAPESPLVKFKESLGGVASLYDGVCELPQPKTNVAMLPQTLNTQHCFGLPWVAMFPEIQRQEKCDKIRCARVGYF